MGGVIGRAAGSQRQGWIKEIHKKLALARADRLKYRNAALNLTFRVNRRRFYSRGWGGGTVSSLS